MTRRTTSAHSRRKPSAWGTVEQLPSGRWRAFYRRDGRKITAPTTFATRAAGDAWLAGEFADRSRGVWRDPQLGRVTLTDFAIDWLATRADLAPRTRAHYEHTLHKWILQRIGEDPGRSRGIDLGQMHVADITPAVARTWYAATLTTARVAVAERLTTQRTRQSDPARVWAAAHGFTVAPTGRLSPDVQRAWRAAGEPRPARPARLIPDNAGESAATNAYRVLRAVLNVAVADGILTSNPCQIKGAGEAKRRERGTASPAEVAQLAAHMPRHLSAAVTVAAWSGLRYGELFALARRHVDLNAGTLTIERALVQLVGQPITFGRTKTAKSQRVVTLPRFVLDVLAAHLTEHVADSPDALVFSLPSGAPVSTPRLSAVFAKARTIVGRTDLTWHDLRHTGATLAYSAGASVPEVQRRLGHTTMRAAQLYAHAADDSDRVLAARLDEMFSASSGTAATLKALG